MNTESDWKEDIKGMSSFDMMIYGALKTQEFSRKMLIKFHEAASKGEVVSDSIYLSMIADLNIQTLTLLTYVTKAYSESKGRQEANEQTQIDTLRSISIQIEKIARMLNAV